MNISDIINRYHNDESIKFQHSESQDITITPLNAVGVTNSESLRSLSITPSNSNSIFVSDTSGNDTTGTGTSASPVKTITKAITLIDSTHNYIIIQDSATYEEDAITVDSTNFKGLFSALGQTPIFKPVFNGTEVDDFGMSQYNSVDTYDSGDTERENFAVMLNNGLFAESYKTGSAGYIKLYNNDGTTYKSITVYSGVSGSYIEPELYVLNNGNLLALYAYGSTYKQYYTIYDDEGIVVKSETEFSTNFAYYSHLVGISTNNVWCMFYRKNGVTDGFFMQCFNNSGVQTLGETQINNDEYYPVACSGLSNGNFVFIVQTSSANQSSFCVYNTSGNEIVELTEFADVYDAGNINCSYVSAVENDDNFLIAYINGYSGSATYQDAYYHIYSNEGTELVSRTNIGTSLDALEEIQVTPISAGGWAIGFIETTNTDALGIAILDEDGVIENTLTPITESETTDRLFICHNTKNQLVVWGPRTGYSTGQYYSLSEPLWSGIKVSNPFELNGITIDGDDKTGLYKLIELDSSTLTIKYCDLRSVNPRPNNNLIHGSLIYGTPTSLTLSNSILSRSDAGIIVDSNTVDIDETAIHDIILDYALYIDGAGSGININHLTVFDVYEGIFLENNDGDEVIKNSIFYKNINGSIEADTTLEIDNSIITDAYTTITLASTCKQFNPRFIDTGDPDTDTTDLRLKTLAGGYTSDSPAVDLADDDSDAGCYDVSYTYGTATWTTATVIKPYDMGYSIKPVKATKNIMSDGTVKTRRKGLTLYLKLKWKSLLNDELIDLFNLWESEDNQIRIYPDPTTHPEEYILMTKHFNDINLSPDLWMFSEVGSNDLELVFSVKWE